MKIGNRRNAVLISYVIFACAILTLTADVFGQKPTTSGSICVHEAKGKPSENSGEQTFRALYNLDYAPCKTAVEMLRAASVIVTGVEIEPHSPNENIWMTAWLIHIGKTPAYKQSFDEGLRLVDAINALKDVMASGGMSLPWQVFDDVYGRSVTKAERNVYEPQFKAKKVTYMNIFGSERNKLNKNPVEREAMINRAFQKAKNRLPTAAEMSYWKPRTDAFITVVKALAK